MSEPSPYRSAGLNSWARPGNRHRKPVDGALFGGNNGKGLPRTKHLFQPASKPSERVVCNRCHLPQFLADTTPCPGRKK